MRGIFKVKNALVIDNNFPSFSNWDSNYFQQITRLEIFSNVILMVKEKF